ncbi:MAG: 2-hydroxychromene-2-carboxylate isomerase [Rhodospirillales bacterium]|nr:2-hydroxychromene-2-carboxylate isomerase [Rhodospirillales bacterium]
MTLTTRSIDYYFSVISPWTYFGDQRFRALAKQHGYEVRHHPQLSPVLFPATGGLALKDRAAPRKAYRLMELERWSKHLGIPINLQPKFFPIPEAPASKLILAALDLSLDVGELTRALGCATWQQERDISDSTTLAAIATACGLDGPTLLAASTDKSYDQKLNDETQAAIARGVFGYPTYALGNELFWGQDRLDFLERALQQT